MIQLYTNPLCGEKESLNACTFVWSNDSSISRQPIAIRVNFPDNTVFTQSHLSSTMFRVTSGKPIKEMDYDIMIRIDGVWTECNDLKSLKYNQHTISQYLKKHENLIKTNKKYTGYTKGPVYKPV